MATILAHSDFKGFARVVLSPVQKTRFDEILEQSEMDYFGKILGIELAELFKTDYLANNGDMLLMQPRFARLLEPMAVDYGRNQYNTNSIKESVTLYIFSEYYEDLHTIQTSVGLKQTESQNSKTPTTGRYKNYNKAVKKGKAVQSFIIKNKSDYPEFRGERLYTNNPIW